MKKIILALVIAVGLFSCSNYGKKIKVEGTKAEVYYKGDGVTESDAKKVGDFLKDQFFASDKAASVQITKEGEVYTIRFVYNKSVYDTLKGVDDEFKLIAAKASKEIFGGKKVNIALADNTFKDFKTIPYDEDVAKTLDAPPPIHGDDDTNPVTTFKKEDFDHDQAGGVNFYWKDISDDQSKTIADYIVKNGAFAGGTAEIYMTKEDGRIVLRFPMIESARTDPSYIAEVDKVAKEIKDNVFADVPYSFIVTDEQLKTVKAWDF